MVLRSNPDAMQRHGSTVCAGAIVLTVLTVLALLGVAGRPVLAQSSLPKAAPMASATPQGPHEEELDHLVAVVGDQAVLQSDVDDEMRFTALQSIALPAAQNTPQNALARLIDRTLIDEERALQPSFSKVSDAQVEESIADLKKDIPACAHAACSSAAGWKAFLQSQGFTRQEVQDRMKERMQILKFIDWRFGSTIRVTPEEIRAYYQAVLLPQFAKEKATPPPMDKVTSRIREILEQQHITTLLDEWLKGLRSQGEVHIVDPAYASVGGAS